MVIKSASYCIYYIAKATITKDAIRYSSISPRFPSFCIISEKQRLLKCAKISRVQVQKVGKKFNGERGLFFTPKNTKSPWKSRPFVLGCNRIAALRLREAQPHWCEASHHCEAHHLRLAATSLICAASWGMMFSLRSKWCWPSVKWCCACGTNEKVQVVRLGLFGHIGRNCNSWI